MQRGQSDGIKLNRKLNPIFRNPLKWNIFEDKVSFDKVKVTFDICVIQIDLG